MLVRSGAFSLPAAAVLALLPIVARGPLELGSAGYGILVGCFGVGAATSAVVRPRLAAALPPDPLMNLGAVIVAAPLNVPSSMAEHASALYARNVLSLIELGFDFEDEVVKGACVVRDGKVVER